jgi:hypothetical protein
MNNEPRTTDQGQSCIHCPTPENFRCAGLDVRRFCELIDPACRQYDSRYRDVIVRETRRAGEDATTRLPAHDHSGLSKSIIERQETIAIHLDCCGGSVLPGIFLP